MPATTLTTLKKIAFTLLCCTVLMVFAAPAQTLQSIKADPGTNNPPPAGAILDLSGTPIPGGGNSTYQQYTVNFTANIAYTAITFAFREDPAFISFANASVVDLTTESGNLLTNGDFSGGTYTNNGNSSTPIGWTYANQYGAYAGGIVQSPGSCAPGYPNCWYDGAVQAYDAISQTIATTVGDNYQITFYVADNSECYTDSEYSLPCNFSDLSTNGDSTDTGGNGINVTVYAQAGLPPAGNTLTLTELGLGDGTVTDNTGQINCTDTNGTVTGTCSGSYASGTVTLTEILNSGTSTFGGWGGACASFGTGPTCTLTMNSSQNVNAIFNAPGPTQVGQAMPGTELDLNFAGGFSNNGYDASTLLANGSPSFTVQVNAIVQPAGDSPSCNQLVNLSFPGAQCFVYSNPITLVPYGTVMFEYTCPGSDTQGTCGAVSNADFIATLGTDFYFDNINDSLFYANSNLPLVGWLKGSGPNPLEPCTPGLDVNGNPLPLFQSNQISSFTDPTTPSSKGSGKGGSSGTGSCWTLTYLTTPAAGPNSEAPSVTITAPANGGTFQQGQIVDANFTCTAVNAGASSLIGPYLTVASCTLSDTWPGGSASYSAPIPSPASVITYSPQIDTGTPGPHTLTATVVDSALNTVSSTSVNYNVVGATDVAIANLAPLSAATGSQLTYVMGVGDLGNATAVNVVVNDTLDPGTSFVSASGSNVACGLVNKKVSCQTIPFPCVSAGPSGPVSCTVGPIYPLSISSLNGAVIKVVVKVNAPAGTKLTNTATVSASNADSKLSNNSSAAKTTVTAH